MKKAAGLYQYAFWALMISGWATVLFQQNGSAVSFVKSKASQASVTSYAKAKASVVENNRPVMGRLKDSAKIYEALAGLNSYVGASVLNFAENAGAKKLVLNASYLLLNEDNNPRISQNRVQQIMPMFVRVSNEMRTKNLILEYSKEFENSEQLKIVEDFIARYRGWPVSKRMVEGANSNEAFKIIVSAEVPQ
jgi:hypothetical protein